MNHVDMIQLEDPSHGLVEAFLDDGVSFSLLIFSNSNDNLILCALRQISSLQAQLPSSHFLAPPQILLVFPDQIFGFMGIDYSSPTLATTLMNFVLAFTFILTIIFRMEKLAWNSTSSQAKVVGTIASITGAFIVTLYKGEGLMISLGFIVQVNETPLIIPSYFKELIIGGFLVVLIITFYISLFSAVLAALLSLITVRDPGTWALKVDSGLVAIIYSTLAGTLFRVTVIMWCLKRRGPVYVAMFQPLGIIFAVVLGVIVLGDSICCGRCFLQLFMYIGIGYSSPTLASAMSDLTPAFTFILAIISRMEKVDLGVLSSRAKFVGTLVSIIGALTLTLLKGLPLIDNGSTTTLQQILLPQSSWIVGAIFLASAALVLSLLYIVQTWIIREYPAELVVALGSCISTAINSSVFTLILERDRNAWRLKPGIELIAIGYAAVFAVAIRNVAHTWACRTKGPLYVSMFKPLGMVFAIIMGVSLLKDTLYLGSVIGAAIIAVGFYAVNWGKAQEERIVAECRPICESNRAPLLNTKVDIQ
ncbi:hypothetical protein CDL15_Pgr009685 [Punica granatum]|uniref:EamA domain-containing protein n=1 Tax=Punica granatum TaxID=22663 RepID=A0A218WUK0_PUNGR|nr:hypothetical protein CDL15_Pgr009685 [Punica granatum]